MTAKETIAAALDGKGCLGKSQPEEPVFVLTARDICALPALKAWLHAALEHLPPSHPKIADAHAILMRMELWPTHRVPD